MSVTNEGKPRQPDRAGLMAELGRASVVFAPMADCTNCDTSMADCLKREALPWCCTDCHHEVA